MWIGAKILDALNEAIRLRDKLLLVLSESSVKNDWVEDEVIKAFALSEDFDFKILENYIHVCDYFLFDTKGKERGGNGTLFDWKILEGYHFDKPFFLSGGIGLAEVNRIESFLKSPLSNYCYAIDVNSENQKHQKYVSQQKNWGCAADR